MRASRIASHARSWIWKAENGTRPTPKPARVPPISRAPDSPTLPCANTTVASSGPSATRATVDGTSSTADRFRPPAVASATAARSASHGVTAHPREQCGDDGNRDDGVRQREEDEREGVRRVAGAAWPLCAARRRRQVDDDGVADLVGDDVAEDPGRERAGSTQSGTPPVPTQRQPEADAAKRRQQRDRLDDDAAGRAQREQQGLRRRQPTRLRVDRR